MRMAKALVIVLVIDGVGIFSNELECDSPATAHPFDSPSGMEGASDARSVLLRRDVAHERPSKRAKPACEGPARWACWASPQFSLYH